MRKTRSAILAAMLTSLVFGGMLFVPPVKGQGGCVRCTKFSQTANSCWFCTATGGNGYYWCQAECNFCSAFSACPTNRPPGGEQAVEKLDVSALTTNVVAQAAVLDMQKAVVLAMARRGPKGVVEAMEVTMNTSRKNPLSATDIGFWLDPTTPSAAKYHSRLNKAIKKGGAETSSYTLSVIGGGTADEALISVRRTDISDDKPLVITISRAGGAWAATSVELRSQQ